MPNFHHCLTIAGQFWNILISVKPFTGVDRSGNPVLEWYVVNITSSFTGEERSYTGRLNELTWSLEVKCPCLYVGNRQAGPIYEIRAPNDSIIEGHYSEYLVPDIFSEEQFIYGLFEEDNCQTSPICSAENRTIDSIVYIWPTTPVGATAIFKCPNNPTFSVARNCKEFMAVGMWQKFDQQGCHILKDEFMAILKSTVSSSE